MTATALHRFQELWHLKTTNVPLTDSEMAELDILEAEVLAEEATYLAPANARLRAEVDHKAQEVAILEQLLQQAEALVASPDPKSAEWVHQKAALLHTYRNLHTRKDTEIVAQ